MRLEEAVLLPQRQPGRQRLVLRRVLVLLGALLRGEVGVVRQRAARAVARPRLLGAAPLVSVTGGDGGSSRPGRVPLEATVTAMPELPEVESVRRQLAPRLTGRVVDDVWWDPHPEQRFSDVDAVVGRRLEDVRRRGKYLLLPATRTVVLADGTRDDVPDDRAELVLHLGMTGSFRFADVPSPPDVTHVRARFHLDDGSWLLFRDPRRFGRVSVVPEGDHATIPTLASLGPEPLSDEFTVAGFVRGLRATTATVKAALLGQRLVCGVGNIYADESLWLARIHPMSRRVGRDRAARLHAAVREVIAAAIEREGTTFRDYQMVNGASGRNAPHLEAYGREGLPCSRCGTVLRGTVVAQRGTTYCPGCQRV